MNKSVVVTGSNGQVIVKSSNNPLYGYIRVEQEREIFDEETGFLRRTVLSALVPGLVKDLERLGWIEGQLIPGRIRIQEQMLPFNRKDASANLKIAGDTNVVCEADGKSIYRNTFYTPNPEGTDTLIPHTNGEQIRQAWNESQGTRSRILSQIGRDKEDDLQLD